MRVRSTSFALALGLIALSFLRPSLEAQQSASVSQARTSAQTGR
jgi:hypothetical protein